jgi:eukaryotic-like serine/threonine-protein kinase
MSLSPGSRLGPYEILSPLGAGGMGEVYRARDTRLGRDVAVKILPPRLHASAEVRARFEREAKTISSLNHPHICTLHDIGREGEVDYLVMELVEGETLASRLARGPLPPDQALRLGAEIADALSRAHRAGIVHRDLKPGNVMVTKAGAKLMDFGLARTTGLGGAAPSGETRLPTLTHSPTLAAPLTAEGTLVGTFQYMAPEQLEGKEADERSDLWALGCVLYEMLTGKRAFEGASQASLISSIMKDQPRPLGELAPLAPAALDRLVRQCLAKDPDERWQSAADLRRELLWLAGTDASREGRAEALPRGETPRNRLLAVAGAVGLAAAIAAVGGFLAGRRSAAPAASSGVTYKELTFRSQGVFSARFMPDGKTTVLGSVLSDNRIDLFAIRPEYAEPQPFGAPGTHLLDISKGGELAVLTGAKWIHHRQFSGTLARMPLGDAAPREILEGVREAAWGPDGESLAIIHLVNGEDRLEYPIGTVLVRTGGYLSDPRVSPDGERVAFMEHQNRWDDRGMVSVVDRSGQARRLTKVFAEEEGLVWSQDGREVLFSAGVNTLTVHAVDLEGRSRIALGGAGGLLLQDIAPDGRWLVVRGEGQGEIRGEGPGGGGERDLTYLSLNWSPTISGDGRVILFSNGDTEAGPNYSVCLRRTDGSPVVRLGEGDAVGLSPDGKWALAVIRSQPPRMVAYPTGAGQPMAFPRGNLVEYDTPRWFPDGKRVLACGHEEGRASRCWTQEVAGGSMKPVTPEGINDGRVSPDGRFVMAWGEEMAAALYPAEGGDSRPVPVLTLEDRILRFSPDGKAVYVWHRGLPALVEKVDLATGRRERLREVGSGGLPGMVWVGEISLADDLRSYVYTRTSYRSTLFLVEGAR